MNVTRIVTILDFMWEELSLDLWTSWFFYTNVLWYQFSVLTVTLVVCCDHLVSPTLNWLPDVASVSAKLSISEHTLCGPFFVNLSIAQYFRVTVHLQCSCWYQRQHFSLFLAFVSLMRYVVINSYANCEYHFPLKLLFMKLLRLKS